MNPKLLSNKLLHGVLLSAGLVFAMASRVADAAIDLADVPLANATSATIRPNIAFVLDDSGSMADENMPNDDGTNKGSNCYRWTNYNTLAYNPGQTYKPPAKSDGTRYPDAVFTSALKDGYFGESEKQFDKTSNATVNLSAPGTVFPTTAVIAFEPFGSSKYYVKSLKVTLLNGTEQELMNGAPRPSSATNNVDTLGNAVRDSINDNTNATGFSASYNSATDELIIFAPSTQAGLVSTPSITREKASGSVKNVSISAFSSAYYATHNTNAASTTCDTHTSYTAVTLPNQIAAPGAANGSTAALTNYANWYSYYRKRAYLMKAGVGEAFSLLEQGKFRVGLFYINAVKASSTNSNLAIDEFSGSHRQMWFSRLYGARSGGSTPLRGALSRMGQMYAGKISGWDPVQHSCQRNYTILSTDGYWNDSNESETYGPKKIDGSNDVGDQDGATGVTAPSLDKLKAGNTLADVAYYYYHTDLRPGTCSGPDVCTNNVAPAGTDAAVDDVATHQHMTTFTLGLGVNGSLTYMNGYKTSSSGDYFDIKQGSKTWPNPDDGSNDNAHRIDDLWHAAVNGRGTYFSAKDPSSLASSLVSSLSTIESVSGSGAAAATSNLQPTTGDQAIYIANYRTVQWDGNVSAYTVNLTNGTISTGASWDAAALLASKVGAGGDTDFRTIYTADGTTRIMFKKGTGGLTNAQLAYFDNTKLSQYSDWGSGKRATAKPELMVNYLRGHHLYEDQDGNAIDNRLYRDRQKILGDIIHSQPIYVKAPPHDFTDDGYFSFKSENQDRPATLYVAANDGMLHAFNAISGQERWAYVPPMVIPELWRLADKMYSLNHHYFLDGPITVSDAKIGGSWKTILIGALGKGGRGYYALDITNPEDPKPLWNFTASTNNNVGYSYGTPFITKLNDGSGTWVAVLTSGYNNIPEGGNYTGADGAGYVFVVNLATGNLIRSISTSEGSVASPSGLARINVEVADFSRDNTAVAAYGGDLYGNMWKFDLLAGTKRKVAAFGANKPVTAGPEIGDVDGKKVIFFGTGRYLGEHDLSDTSGQSIYGIRDDGTTTVTEATNLVQQSVSTNGDNRNISTNSVDWESGYGWFVNLPDTGERVAIEPQLYFGTLVVASIVPQASECQPGGYSWLYQIDYRTGGNVTSLQPGGSKHVSPVVGVTVSKLPGGSAIIYPVPADGRTPAPIELNLPPSGSTGETKRVLWRSLGD